MAYRVQNIDPLDLKPSTAIGVSIPFNQPNVFTSVYTTQEQLKYNLINFILTEPGERLYDPLFGLGLRRKLFQQITEGYFEELKDYISTKIEAYFTNIEIGDLNIIDNLNNSITVSLSYTIKRTGVEDQILINIENV